MKYSCQGALPLLGTYCTDHIGRKTGLCHPARLSQQAVTTQFYMSSLKLPVSCLEEYSFRSRQSHRSSYVPIALVPLRITEDPEPFRVSSLTVSKTSSLKRMRLMKSLLTRDLGEFFESMKYLCLGWHPQSSWLHETKVFSGESGSYEIGHLSSTPIVSAQHSTSRPYLFYNLSNAYTGLDSRIISTRLGGLRKLGASMTSPCLDTVLSKLYHKKLLEDYHKKLLKVYHEEMGDAAAMPLPDEDDKNYTTKQHYTGLFRMSQVNHIQDGEKE
ncbi:hypothetical protein EAE99_003936 [Botrytis elliptica]|nr:hypothetical protein EAE99_003936 [Botrytis elliptica]